MSKLPIGTFSELADEEREGDSLFGQYASRVLICNISEWESFYPAKLTPHPTRRHLRLVERDKEPYGPDLAKLTLGYALVTSEEDAPRARIGIGSEILEVGGERTYNTGGKKVLEPVGKTIPLIDLQYEMTRLDIPMGAILACAGKINATPYAGFSALHLMFLGVESERLWDSTLEIFKYRCRYQFAGHTRSWEDRWNPYKTGGPGWDTLNPPLFETADFSMLGLV